MTSSSGKTPPPSSHQQQQTYADSIPDIPDLLLSPESPLQIWWKKYLDALQKEPVTPTKKHRAFDSVNGVIAVHTNYHVDGILPRGILGFESRGRFSTASSRHSQSDTTMTPRTPRDFTPMDKGKFTPTNRGLTVDTSSVTGKMNTPGTPTSSTGADAQYDERESWIILKYFLQEYLKIDKKSCKGHPDVIVKTLCELYDNESASYIEALNDEKNLHEDKIQLPSTPPQYSSSLGSSLGSSFGASSAPHEYFSPDSPHGENNSQNQFGTESLGMIRVMIKCADWIHNRLLILQYGLFTPFFEVIHAANDRIRHTKNISHILQILKEIIVPHFVFLAKFLGVPTGEFHHQYSFASTRSSTPRGSRHDRHDYNSSSESPSFPSFHTPEQTSRHASSADTPSPSPLHANLDTHYTAPNSFHEYDKLIIDHLDNMYKIAKLLIETLQVTSEILENNPSVSFLFSLQELLLHSVRKIFFVDRKEPQDKISPQDGHKVLLYLLLWPLEHKQLVTSSDGQWQNIDFSLLDPKRIQRYYELRMFTLHIVCEAVAYNQGLLNRFMDIGLFEYVAQLGLWLTYFFSFDVEGDYMAIIQTLKDNVTEYEHYKRLSTQSSGAAGILEDRGADDRPPTEESEPESSTKTTHNSTPSTSPPLDFISASYTPPKTDTAAHSPGLIKKLMNPKMRHFFHIFQSLILQLHSFESSQDLAKHSRSTRLLTCIDDPRDSASSLSVLDRSLSSRRDNRMLLPLIFFEIMSDENVDHEALYTLEARKKLKLFSDFQLYFLDQIFVTTLSYKSALNLYVSNGLYDMFFSEYLYFYGGQSNLVNRAMDLESKIKSVCVMARRDASAAVAARDKSTDASRGTDNLSNDIQTNTTTATDTDLLSTDSTSETADNVLSHQQYNQPQYRSARIEDAEKHQTSQTTAEILRQSVLHYVTFAATSSQHTQPHRHTNSDPNLESNRSECRTLLSVLASNASNPFVVREVGACFIDIIEHRYEISQRTLQELRAFSITSFVLEKQHQLLKQLEALMRMERTRNNFPVVEGISNMQLVQRIKEARNTLLRLLTILLHYDSNHILVLDDQNTLNCLFSCLFDASLRDYGLQHLKKLIYLRVDNSAAFSSLVQTYISTMRRIISDPNSDSIHLLLMILKMLHGALRTSPMLQAQFRNYFDEFILLVNVAPESIQDSGVSPKEYVWMLLKNLNMILSSRTHQFIELENKLKVTFPQMAQHLLGSSRRTAFIHTPPQQHDSEEESIASSPGLMGSPSPQILKDLLNLMVDGEFSESDDFIIQNAFVLPLMFPFALNYDEKEFVAFVESFTNIIKKSVRNRDICCQVGLVGTLLEMIEDVSSKYDSRKSFLHVTAYVVHLLEILGKHSINVKELKTLFFLLKRQSETMSFSLLNYLFNSLKGMTNNTPSTYYNFDLPNSGLAFPTIDRFPSTGYTFCTWLRLHPLEDLFGSSSEKESSESDERQRYLFSFMNEKNKPILEAYFQNDLLHLSTKRDVALGFKFDQPKKWYHVAVVHGKKHFLAKPEARLFVDGKQVNKATVKYPSQGNSYSAHIGRRNSLTSLNTSVSSPANKRNSLQAAEQSTLLYGTVGAFYFFEEALSANQIQQIYALGPQYISTFDPSDAAFFLGQKASIFDGTAQSRLLFGVNSRAHHGGLSLNIVNPKSMPAVILEDTQLCASQNVKDILGCLGGMKVLFPLFLRIDQLSHSEDSSDSFDPYLINSLLLLILELLRNHKDNRMDMIRCKGFQVIGYLLKMISPQHRTELTVKNVPDILNTIAETPELIEQVVQHILFDFKVWIHTPQEVQLKLMEKLISDVSPSMHQHFRKMGIQRIMDMMRLFYWVEIEEVSLGQGQICNPITHQVLGERPNAQGVVEIRQKIIDLMRLLMQFSPTLEEIEVIVSFLSDCQDMIQVRDILRFLLELLIHGDAVCIEYALQAGAFEVVCSLLSKQSEEIVELAIKCVGQLLAHSAKTRQKYGMEQSYGFRFMRVLISTSGLTERVYKALRNILFGQITLSDRDNDVTGNSGGAPSSATGGASPSGRSSSNNAKRSSSSAPASTAALIPGSENSPIPCVVIAIIELFQIASPDILLGLLRDFKSRVDIPAVQSTILKQERWQFYLLELMAKVACSDDCPIPEIISIHKVVMDIFAKCLFHALKYIKGGYRCVEETAAYVFFLAEDHQLSYRDVMSGIYERILTLFMNAVERSEMQTIRVNDTHIMDNFIHLTTQIEEHLFHHNTMTQSLFGRWLKKKKHFSLSLKVSTPLNEGDDDPDTASSTTTTTTSPSLTPSSAGSQRKSSSGTPVVSIAPEDELNINDKGVWKDSFVAGKLLSLLYHWDLLSIASFNSLSKFLSGTKNLREGGTIRITLRLIKYLMLYNVKIRSSHLKYLEQIVRRDVESEKEFQRFSELWAVTGDLKKTDDFHDRIMYILQFLCDAFDHMMDLNNAGDALKVLNCIKSIFLIRRAMLERKLRDQNDRPLLLNPSKFIFFSKKAISLQDYEFIRHGKIWKFIRDKHFKESSKKAARLEEGFTLLIVRKFKNVLNRVNKKSTSYEEAAERLMVAQQEEIRRVVDPIRQKESAHIRNEKSKYEEQERLDAILWKEIMRDVSNERGAWGNPHVNPDEIKWMLDKTENRHRMRLKLKRDYRDISHEGAAMSNFDPTSMAAGDGEQDSTAGGDNTKSDDAEGEQSLSPLKPFQQSVGGKKPPLIRSQSLRNEITMIPRLAIRKDQAMEDASVETPGADDDDNDMEKESSDELSQSASTPAVDLQEKTLIKTYCEVLTPMQAYSGNIEITTRRILITVDKENKCDESNDAIKTKHLQKPPLDRIYSIDQIKEIHLRRYQLLPSAIEIFFINQKNVLLNFKKDERNKLYKKLISVKPPNLLQVNKIRSPWENIARSGLTRLWQKRLISNFDYLMELNTFANRTYNDLSQYPVFPWILSDYKSDKIDLDDPSVYRDLSKPIGALDENRLEEIDARYEMFDDPIIPKFHYGSHYSSPGIVLYYLVRMEPFTTYLRVLQGGKFDHADRMFDSIPQTWHNTQHSSDFKELIPEFFYSPEFLTMTNRVNLGYKANGRRLDNALLPPWAENAADFIRINRKALESEYVSQHLHEWIDLIFGFKQKGSEAVKAKNVFYYLTYEGKVDIEKIEEDHVRRSYVSQIQNFGQTPSQLFKKAHPMREQADPPPYPLKVNFEMRKDFKCNSSIVYVQVNTSAEKVVAIAQDGQVFMCKFSPMSPQLLTSTDCKRASIDFPFAHDVHVSGSCFTFSSGLKDAVFSCGHWDFSLRCTRPFAVQGSSTVAPTGQWRQRDIVTCVTLSEKDEYLVSASRDTTIMTWKIDKSGNIPHQPDNILYGHDDEITCLAVSADLDVVISGSKDGTIMVHTLRSGKYTRSITHPEGLTITQVAISSDTGHVVMYSGANNMLYLYSINGKLLCQTEAVPERRIVSSGGGNASSMRYKHQVHQLVIQGNHLYHDGYGDRIYCRLLEDLSIIETINTYSQSSIRSLSIHDGYAFIGLTSGSLLVRSGMIFRKKE